MGGESGQAGRSLDFSLRHPHSFDMPVLSVVERLRDRPSPLPEGEGIQARELL